MSEDNEVEPTSRPQPMGDPRALGKVAAPPNKESTSEHFYFWVEREKLAERTQIIHTECQLGDRDTPVKFIGLVEEVYRQSRQRDMGEEVDRHDGQVRANPPFNSEGFTYAKATILRTDPVTHAPPTEECTVRLGGALEAQQGYGIDRMRGDNRLSVGLLRNGGTGFAGKAVIDLAYLLGENGGHLNVNGIAGLGAKSSFLLHINYLLLRRAAELKELQPGLTDRLQLVPIIFNVKNFDLFFIDLPNKNWKAESKDDWTKLGISDPGPFKNVQFFAPQLKNLETPVNVGRSHTQVSPYSWGLADVITNRLFRYLFAESDINDANFGALVGSIEEWLTYEDQNGASSLRDGVPLTFQDLYEELKDGNNHPIGDHHSGTLGKFLRRFRGLLQDGDGVLRRRQRNGHPLIMPASETAGPIVIDLYGINRTPSLQRFVVAAVFHQLVELRSGNTVEGLRYLVTLDELNRFAPKGSSDPITEKIEQVAAEMRSQGVILLGAQQQASLVSPRVIENAGIRAIGRSGTLELSSDVWKFLSPASRSQAAQILEDEKMLVLPTFRAPMLAKIPFPPWALRKEEASIAQGNARRPDDRFAADTI
jgi:uncharacterized protein